MRLPERRCGRGPGPLGGRVTGEAKPRAGLLPPPHPGGRCSLSPAQTSPKRARAPAGAGGAVPPHHPALSPPLLCSASVSGSRFSTAASWAPPGAGGSRGPASAPFPSRARGRRAPGRWARRARTGCAADRRVREPAAGRRDPAGGRRPPPRSGTGRGRGRRRRKGRRQIAAVSAYGADTRVSGRPNPQLGPPGTPAGRKAWSGVFVGRLLET